MLFLDFVQHYIKSYSFLLSPPCVCLQRLYLDLAYSITLDLEGYELID